MGGVIFKKSLILSLVAVFIVFLSAVGYFYLHKDQQKTIINKAPLNVKNMRISLSSPAFKDGMEIPKKYTCDDKDMSPDIFISGVPEGTKSLVLIVDDPDAPNGDWVHWVMYNIDPKTEHIEENSTPQGAKEGLNTAGKIGYHGPCPPKGSTHHYYFKIYAIDKVLDIAPEHADKDTVLKEINENILAMGQVIGIYERL